MQGVSRPRLIGLLDNLALVALLAGIAIHLAGGFEIDIGDVTLSARREGRPLFVALVALALRLLLDRTTPPPAAWRTFLNRMYDPLADEPRASWSVSWNVHGLALAGFCAFGLVLLWSQISRLDAIPEIGDPLFSVWRVSWVYRQLLGDPRDLFDANIFYPQPADVHLLRLDAPAGADGDALARGGSPSRCRHERHPRAQLRGDGVHDVSPGRPAHPIVACRLHLRPDLRLLSVPVRPLPPLRVVDDVLPAARAPRSAPLL